MRMMPTFILNFVETESFIKMYLIFGSQGSNDYYS